MVLPVFRTALLCFLFGCASPAWSESYAIEREREIKRQQDREEMAHYCAVARRWIDAGSPRLVIMHGLSGSGKTCLSRQLMRRLPAIRVRSDIERKRMHGLGETDQTGSAVGGGLYSPGEDARVYERLAALAELVLQANDVDVADVEEVRGTQVGRQVLLFNQQRRHR